MTISGVCSLWLCLMPHPRPCTNASSTIIGPRLGSVAPQVRIPPICWTTTQENSENPIPSPYPIRWCTGSKSQLNLRVSSRTTNPITVANVGWEVSPADQWGASDFGGV